MEISEVENFEMKNFARLKHEHIPLVTINRSDFTDARKVVRN